MPAITYDALNQNQGFNYAKDVQDPVGYMKTLNVGGTAIPADISIKHPKGGDTAAKFVGVLTKVDWSPGSAPGDPIEFNFQVSTANKLFIQQLLHQTLVSIACTFDFIVYDYDPLQKDYFIGLQNDSQGFSPIKAQIFKEGGKDLQLKVGAKGTEVQAPENWGIILKVVSAPTMQQMCFATSMKADGSLNVVVKTWGVGVG